tara:strand:- start:293 stop:559 length:267 start_codon:yes stop_codon:yes gene_type:complete
MFLLATFMALASGISEISAIRKREISGDKQNIATPAFILAAKSLGLPKLYQMAVNAQLESFSFFHSSFLPFYSRLGAVVICTYLCSER